MYKLKGSNFVLSRSFIFLYWLVDSKHTTLVFTWELEKINVEGGEKSVQIIKSFFPRLYLTVTATISESSDVEHFFKIKT